MIISQVMRFDVESCKLEDNLKSVAEKMWKKDIGCLPVTNVKQRVVGMITDRDICMAALNENQLLSNIAVSAVMSKELYSCQADDTVAKAEAIMRRHRIRRLPIVDKDGKLAGMVSLDDLALEAERELGTRDHAITSQEVTATLASVSQPRQR